MNHESPFGALAGLKVIDLSRALAGPYCAQIFGDHGADILKIEPPQGDETRDWGPPFHEGDASYFIGVNRNKRAMPLDLRREEGRSVLLRLLETADILLENFRPGTMEKWGLGYHEVLAERFPSLIHARISGFGSEGAYGGFPGYDAVVQAMAGMFSVNGTRDSGPTRLGIALVDMGTGLYTAIAILMAVVERHRSGCGQYLDMTLYDSAISLMHPHVANYYLSGKVPGRTGNAHSNLSPYDKFRTRTTEIFVAAGNNRAFVRLCAEIGVPELAEDPRFRENRDRGGPPGGVARDTGGGACRSRRIRAVRTPDEGGARGGSRYGHSRSDVPSPHRRARDGGRARLVPGQRHADQDVTYAGGDPPHAAGLRCARARDSPRARLLGRGNHLAGTRRCGAGSPSGLKRPARRRKRLEIGPGRGLRGLRPDRNAARHRGECAPDLRALRRRLLGRSRRQRRVSVRVS